MRAAARHPREEAWAQAMAAIKLNAYEFTDRQLVEAASALGLNVGVFMAVWASLHSDPRSADDSYIWDLGGSA